MASVTTPKSILKKTPATDSGPTKEERDLETALYHANLIQHRKDLEFQIVLSIERFIDFPLTPGYSAENPAPEDVKEFKSLLRPFQPSDYDALIEERNINEHCGYTLCPKPRVKKGGSGKYRVLGHNGKDFRVVPKGELDKWCSDDCAKRALYVRVQLSERPAWERAVQTAVIELLDEPKTEEETKQALLLEDMRKLQLGETERREKGKADLALERGDQGASTARGLVGVSIQENEVTRPAQPPSFDVDDLDGRLSEMHLKLEGHTPSFTGNRHPGGDDDEFDYPKDGDSDEDVGMDWR